MTFDEAYDFIHTPVTITFELGFDNWGIGNFSHTLWVFPLGGEIPLDTYHL